jgi:hypothetical protein
MLQGVLISSSRGLIISGIRGSRRQPANRSATPNRLLDLAKQQQPAVRGQMPAVEPRLD